MARNMDDPNGKLSSVLGIGDAFVVEICMSDIDGANKLFNVNPIAGM